MGLAQALEETTRYEMKNQIKQSQMFFTDSESADVGLPPIYKMFHWYESLEESGKTTHVSHCDDCLILSAGCYGSCMFGRDSGCVFRCLWKGTDIG